MCVKETILNNWQGKLKQCPPTHTDHPNTSLNADDLVAMTTRQPQGPWGYLSSGVMWQGCVFVFGVTWGLKRSERKVAFFLNNGLKSAIGFVLQMDKKKILMWYNLWPNVSVPTLLCDCLETKRISRQTEINACMQRQTWKHFLSWYEVDQMKGKRAAETISWVCVW